MPCSTRHTVGIRYPQWSSSGPATLGGIVDFMRRGEPWRLVTENDSYGEMEGARIDAGWRGDGLILFRATEEELAAYRKHGIPAVLTSTEGPDLGFPRVVPDNPAIGVAAARHLLACGLTDFAFLARGETFYREAQFAPGFRVYARERLRGFRSELSAHLIEPHIHYLRGRPLWEDHTWREIETEVSAFLSTLPKPCGLFVVDDSLAAVALRAADTLGLRVPTELAVIGYGNDPAYCYSSFPALSSIAHPAREIGRQAADLLLRQIRGERVEGSFTIPPGETVARESSDVLAISDPVIRDLVGWIRSHATHDSVRVSELAERSGLSLTTLKERFAQRLGHSPKQEIQSVRVRHLKHLLATTNHSFGAIAKTMGFSSGHELGRFFKAATGIRPSDFRREKAALDTARRASGHAVIFDMDGTLFDSESIFFEAFARAYAQQGGTLPRDVYFREHAGTTNEQIEDLLARAAGRGFDRARFARAWRDEFSRLLENDPLVPFPDVTRALARLRERQIPVGLASSSSLADIGHLLGIAGLTGCFESLTGGDEVPVGKPEPAIFRLAAQRLGFPPARCLVIEDSMAGVTAGRAAGARVIHVERHVVPNPDARQAADLGVTCLDEVDWALIEAWFTPPAEQVRIATSPA
jgi:LacI family transcriptional regulator